MRRQTDDEHVLYVRVSAEFREMPGLIITLAQAARLFCVEPARCAPVLEALVDDGVLRIDGRFFSLANADR